jgi:DNA polymerase III alpha subunit
VEKLVAVALKNEVRCMALTDINNGTGMMDFIAECRTNGIKPIAGMELRDENNRLLYITIARNNNGYREINEFLTLHNLEDTPLPVRAPAFDHVYTVYSFNSLAPVKLSENEFSASGEEINRLVTSRYRYNQQQLLALLPVTFGSEGEHELHRHLRAIGKNTLLDKLTPADVASPKELFLPADFIRIIYSDYPQLLKNTERLISECVIDMDFSTVKNKRTLGSRYDDRLLPKSWPSTAVLRYGKSNRKP